ncbi:MAG: hypothetical protein ACI91B_000900 [Planctomycetota bacterium]|jgi:hypothetical protein
MANVIDVAIAASEPRPLPILHRGDDRIQHADDFQVRDGRGLEHLLWQRPFRLDEPLQLSGDSPPPLPSTQVPQAYSIVGIAVGIAVGVANITQRAPRCGPVLPRHSRSQPQ